MVMVHRFGARKRVVRDYFVGFVQLHERQPGVDADAGAGLGNDHASTHQLTRRFNVFVCTLRA